MSFGPALVYHNGDSSRRKNMEEMGLNYLDFESVLIILGCIFIYYPFIIILLNL